MRAGSASSMVAEPGRLALGVLPGHQPDAVGRLLRGSARRADGRRVPARRARAWPAAPGPGPAPAVPAPRRGRRPAASPRGAPRSPREVRARGGSSRMAAKRQGAGCAALACQAARPMPVPRQTSQARAMRWLSVGRRRPAVAGSASASRACSAAGPICFSRARASARASAAGVGDVREALGQRGEIEAAAAGEDRQAARLARARPSRRAPHRATTRRCLVRRRGGRRRGHGGPGLRPPASAARSARAVRGKPAWRRH